MNRRASRQRGKRQRELYPWTVGMSRQQRKWNRMNSHDTIRFLIQSCGGVGSVMDFVREYARVFGVKI